MDFIENHKFHVSNKICSSVKHTSKNLGRHDETTCFWTNLYVSRKNSDIIEGFLEVSKFLVTQCFNWGCINCSNCSVSKLWDGDLVMCFAARAIAYSATTVLPAEVCAATNTESPFSR